jgi:hypothetical protein
MADSGCMLTGTLWAADYPFVGRWKVVPSIQAYESDGLSFRRSDDAATQKIKLDGKDYPGLDPSGSNKDSAVSSRRVNELTLEITEKSKGKVTATRQIELSRDLKTLTVTVGLVGQSKPQSILVYRRQ